MSTTSKSVECTYCGNALNSDESESSRTDDTNDVMCDDCYHDKFEFTCCCCKEYGDVKDQHNLLVVFDDNLQVPHGVYRTTGCYVTHAMIGSGWLHPESLERVADVNPGMDGNGYPCGHLCLECQTKVLAQFHGKCRVCLSKSASCLRVEFGSWKDVKAHKYQWSRPKIACAACRKLHRGAWRIFDSSQLAKR